MGFDTAARFLAVMAFERLVATLAPPRCAACDARVPLLAAFCAACASTAERVVESSPRATAALVWGGAVAQAIGRMKYERRPDLARPLGDLLARALEPWWGVLRGSVVVPVPLHPARLAERGFNQAALLGARVARRVGLPFRPLALERTHATERQAALPRAARSVNVAGAFAVRNPPIVQGRAVLLVDDVRTTGATLDACVRAVLDAGAVTAAWAVVARAPRRVEAPRRE